MEVNTLAELVANVGVVGGMCVVALWRLNIELDKRDNLHVQRANELDRLHTQRADELKGDIRELRAEAKEDKQMFNSAILAFENSVREFTNLGNKMANLEQNVKEIRDDIRDLKSE